MSATATKATRRDLRRAVGEEACRIIDGHERALTTQAQAIRQHMAAVDRYFIAHGDEMRAATEPLRRSLWGRLRWLLTGA